MHVSDFLRGFENIYIFNTTAHDAKSAQAVVPVNKGDVHSATGSIPLSKLIGKKIRKNEFYILCGDKGCLVFSTTAYTTQDMMLSMSVIGESFNLDFFQDGNHVRTVQFISSEESPLGKSHFYEKGEKLPIEGDYSSHLDQQMQDLIKAISQIDIATLEEAQPVLSFKRKIR
jgi:hypothetical protein